jgi:feruloyl esterase
VLPPFETTWATDNPDAVTNYAYRANHLVLWAAVGVSQKFYGREPKRRYMIGGSNGGRQGIMAATRYPDDYHGIFSAFPALSIPGFLASWPRVYDHIYEKPENWLNPDALALFVSSELAACDELDGVKDGVIGNYKACKFNAASLACPEGGGVDPKRCLTPGQIETVRLVRSYKQLDFPLAGGLHGYPGYGPGAGASAWTIFILGSNWEARDAFSYIILNQGLKWFTNDPNANPIGFDATKSRDVFAKYSALLDPLPADLGPFFAKGGKMIIWHGVGDTIVSYERTEEFVDLVEKAVGADQTRKSLRFFVSPTLDHYFDGPEANAVPVVALLEAWVEKGKAPDAVIATRLDPANSVGLLVSKAPLENRKVSFTRPLCEHGSFPKYKGRGDTTKAGSFTCSRS